MKPNPVIENISFLSSQPLVVDTLRLDQIHPVISGNKWYKLKYYLQEALSENAATIASFGGPYSNHLVALAFTANQNGMKSVGYIRTNKEEPITPMMEDALNYGMEFVYLGRTIFQEKKNELIAGASHFKNKEVYFIDEGGYGINGAKGAATIITDFTSLTNEGSNPSNPIFNYDYIICAVGTGTMIAGIMNAAKKTQTIIGIPVLKNEGSIENEIRDLLNEPDSPFILLHSYHQGGYAKTTPIQIEFMNRLWEHTKIPTDIVYTGKVFYAVDQLVQQNYFKANSSVLIIHSGGLQGNRSLAKGVLKY